MKSAVTNASVQCDVAPCDWSQRCGFDEIPRWHKKPCPKCGKGEIVNDLDMIAYRIVKAAIAASNDIDPDGNLPRATLRFNTASLRDPATTRQPKQPTSEAGS